MTPQHTPLRAGDRPNAQSITRILTGLSDRTLPKTEWTHAAHLVAGAALLNQHGVGEAERLMPSLIRAYNEATGVENSDSEGYHHTLTLFFLRMISNFLEHNKTRPLADCVALLLASPLAQSDFPLTYYSHARLFSVEARRDWIPPDLQKMD